MTSFWSPRNLERLAKVKLFIVDVDGVLTCGRLFWIKGQGFTRFYHVKDGYGLLMLKNFGIQVALISAGDSEDLKERIQSLKIEHAYLGDHDKMKAYDDLLQKTGLSPEETLFVGCLPVFLERKRTQTSPLQIVHLGTVCLLWVFAFFYQCNPEYYNLLTPGLLTFCSNWVSLGLLGGVLLLPWLANYGYAVYMSTLYPFGPGKKALVQPFFSLNLLSPLAFKSLTLGMSTAMTFGIAIWATYFYWRRYVFEGKSF